MAGTVDTTEVTQPPNWFIRMCKWLWKHQKFFWGTVILGIAISAFAGLLFIQWPWNINKSLDNTGFKWLIQNPFAILTAGVIILLVLGIIYLGSRFQLSDAVQVQQPPQSPQQPEPVASNEKHITEERVHNERDRDEEIRMRYLNKVCGESEQLTLRGIPAGLIAKAVQLDEVFIPLQFWPDQSKTDYPLTREEVDRLQEQLRVGMLSDEEEQVLAGAEIQWLRMLEKGERISIADLWYWLANSSPHAVVIQGVPGMGKSTLLQRLTLFMARRLLGKADLTMTEQERLLPLLTPIFLLLGKYAEVRSNVPNLSLEDYLKLVLSEATIEGLEFYILEKCLKAGGCLVLLDGLDEVSDPIMRKQVQDAINEFVRLYQKTAGEGNHFIITSRSAGYDRQAFPDYIQVTVAELTDEQITDFLPRWCHASVRRDRGYLIDSQEKQDVVAREAKQKLVELQSAVQGNVAVKGLASNPLLLTLLAVMQQNSVSLPRRRVELYEKVTETLLENRNIIKGITPIPVEDAIQRLGPLAFKMQNTNGFASERMVMAMLSEAIRLQAGGSSQEITHEARIFLDRVRERGGIFVQRAGDYFSFMHRTFQEYFAARYILNQVEKEPDIWIPKFITMVRRLDALWREPFLLAVAYQSGTNKKIAGDILAALVTTFPNVRQEKRERDLILAIECLIEAVPSSIDSARENRITQQLLQTYQEAQQDQDFQACEAIEGVTLRWLMSLSKEAYRPTILRVLKDAITDASRPTYQCATLTLLTMIAPRLDMEGAPDLVFHTLIPLLLALIDLPISLTGLLNTGKYEPEPAVKLTEYLDVADLAVAALSFMKRHGPSGMLLEELRTFFEQNPSYLRLLGRYSLESKTLLILAFVPLGEEYYQCYEDIIARWIILSDTVNVDDLAEQELESCYLIHKDLLQYANEVCYPMTLHLFQMLQAAANHPSIPWQQIWQNYLSEQLSTGHYNVYQECAMLWLMLFPTQHAQEKLAPILKWYYSERKTSIKRYAQRFIANISVDIRSLRDLRDLREPHNLRDLRETSTIRGLRNIWDIRDVHDLENLRKLRDTNSMRNLQDLQPMRNLRDLCNMKGLRDEVLKKEAGLTALCDLSSTMLGNTSVEEQKDLLTILQGRILHISEADEIGSEVEAEVQAIVQTIHPTFTSRKEEFIREVALDILRYLPLRTVDEISYALNFANDKAKGRRVQVAVAQALRYARPKTVEAKNVLSLGKNSQIEEVRTAVEACLKLLERSDGLVERLIEWWE